MKTRYDVIYRDLRDNIENETFPFQSFLPSESALTETFACSHNTLRRALGLLRDQGYVQPVHGKGVRIIYQRPARTTFAADDIETFREASARQHLETVTRVVELEHIVADGALARQTGFEPGCELTRIERVRIIAGEALILDQNLFRTASVPGITEDIARESIYAYAEDELGLQIATSKRVITVERATARDRALLDIEGIDHLAVVTSKTFDSRGILVERTCSRHRPDHFSFTTTSVRHNV